MRVQIVIRVFDVEKSAVDSLVQSHSPILCSRGTRRRSISVRRSRLAFSNIAAGHESLLR